MQKKLRDTATVFIFKLKPVVAPAQGVKFANLKEILSLRTRRL